MHRGIITLFRNTYVSGAGYLFASNVLVGLMNYVFSSYAAKLLGPAGYSDIIALFSYVAIGTLPLTIASMALLKKIGESGNNNISFSASLERWVLYLMRQYWYVVALALSLIPFMPAVTNLSPVAGYAIIPIILLTALTILYDSILQGLQRFRLFAVISICVVGIKLISVFAGGISPVPLMVIMTGIIASYITRLLVSSQAVHRIISGRKAVVRRIEKRLMQVISHRQVLLSAISVGSITIMQHVPMAIAKITLSPHKAGLLAAWLLLANIALYIVGPLLSVAYIFFSGEHMRHKHSHVFLVSLAVLIIGSIAYVGAYILFGSFLIENIFGEAFTELNRYAVLASVYGVGMLIIIFFNNFFLARGSNVVYVIAAIAGLYSISLYFFSRSIDGIMTISIYTAYSMVLVYGVAGARSYIRRPKFLRYSSFS